MNSWLLDNPDSVLPARLIGITFLIFWAVIGFMSYKFKIEMIKSVIIAHLPALLALLLIISGGFLPNIFVTVSQLYYLPLLRLSQPLTGLFWFSTSGISLLSIIALLFMFAAFYLGNYLRRKLIVH